MEEKAKSTAAGELPLADILIRLPTLADFDRTCASCPAFRRVITGHSSLRRLHALQPPSILGTRTFFGFHPAEAPNPSAPAGPFWMVRDSGWCGSRSSPNRDSGCCGSFSCFLDGAGVSHVSTVRRTSDPRLMLTPSPASTSQTSSSTPSRAAAPPGGPRGNHATAPARGVLLVPDRRPLSASSATDFDGWRKIAVLLEIATRGSSGHGGGKKKSNGSYQYD
ncbi:hypothetical protein SETIT_8G041500v2 [Setaria italica]|uniref:F-box domain-containing protein n=1 Tax=Setaria italica TaxID=4555 RepID=A0A368S5P7_SETIT|nr:hypothetical protein SETIT_8G041500v2 [Setaria italica]